MCSVLGRWQTWSPCCPLCWWQSCHQVKKGAGIRQKTAASPVHEIVEIWSILLQITAQLQCTPFPTIRTAKSTTQTESRMKKVLAMKHVKWNSMYLLKSFISNHQIAAPSFTVKSSCFISVNPFNRIIDDFRWLDIYLTNSRGLQKMAEGRARLMSLNKHHGVWS